MPKTTWAGVYGKCELYRNQIMLNRLTLHEDVSQRLRLTAIALNYGKLFMPLFAFTISFSKDVQIMDTNLQN